MKYIVKKFDSLNEYSRYLNSETSQLFKKYGYAASVSGSYKFTGTHSFDEAENLMKFGDKENLAKLQTCLLKVSLHGSGENKKVETYRSFVGYAPHVPSYVAGQPKTMLRKKVVKTVNAKVLNIMYNPTAHCETTAEELINVSIQIMNFINNLEKQGYKVNLYTLISVIGSKECLSQIVKIKSSDDYTDLAKIVYPMVNPSFLRRHFFKFMEVTDEIKGRGFCGTYGLPIYSQPEVEPLWKQMGIRIDYYFNYYEHTYQLNKVQKQNK
jgi:hypothetical protein